jgi:hypothetical protein
MTLAELRALIRLTLSSATAWPDATLDRWIAGAVRLYSAHFPRRLRATITLAYGTQAYAIPGAVDAAGIISVEYPARQAPAGQTPPRFLRCVAEWSDAFAGGGYPTGDSFAHGDSFARGDSFACGEACYAVRGVADTDTSAAGYIVFAEVVHDGETAVVEYWGPHPAPAPGSDTAVITVPQQHLEALSAYVDFAAHYELETDEALVADGSTIMLAQLGEESRRAWNRYKEVMDRLTWLGAPHSGPAYATWGRYGL